MDNQEKDFFDDVDTDIKPPKKQLSDQKLQHLSNIHIHTLFFLGFALFFLGLALFFLAFTIPAFLGQMCQSGKFNVSRLLTSSEL